VTKATPDIFFALFELLEKGEFDQIMTDMNEEINKHGRLV